MGLVWVRRSKRDALAFFLVFMYYVIYQHVV